MVPGSANGFSLSNSARNSIITTKIERFKQGHTPRVLDLFSGCGGLSLGFKRAKCDIIAGIEIDKDAAATHAHNFHGELKETDEDLFKAYMKPRSVETDPGTLLTELGHTDVTDAVDFLVGGPPCPAFTRVGRAKLREIHDHPEAFKHDPRAKLYLPYLKYVDELAPLVVMMENVPDVLNFGGHNLAEEICEVLEQMGYQCGYSLLNAANYGVPQMRERFILIGIHTLVDATIVFPNPICYVEFPQGYRGSRGVALKPLYDAIEGDDYVHRFIDTPTPTQEHQKLCEPVTVSDALKDLPPITGHLDGSIKKGARNLGAGGGVAYQGKTEPSDYVKEHILNWPGYEVDYSNRPVHAHVIRSLSNRDYRLFQDMEYNNQYPEVYTLALNKFAEFLQRIEENKITLSEQSKRSKSLAKQLKEMLSLFGESFATLSSEEQISLLEEQWEAIKADIVSLTRRKSQLNKKLANVCEEYDDFSITVKENAAIEIWEEGNVLLSLLKGADQTLLNRELEVLSKVKRLIMRTMRMKDAYQKALLFTGMVEKYPEPQSLSTDGDYSLDSIKEHLDNIIDSISLIQPVELFWLPEQKSTLIQGMFLYTFRLLQLLDDFQELKSSFVPPYDPSKFPNKWRKMHPDEPARTLMAHLGKDSYSHIHYDGEQARVLSVREAARLQSFPDGFDFCGSMNAGFRQVGNAVPPLFAYHIARSILDTLERATQKAEKVATSKERVQAQELGFSLVEGHIN